jgi:hypothetical protein
VNVTVVLRGHFVHHMTSKLEFRECLLFGTAQWTLSWYPPVSGYDLQVLLEKSLHLKSELLYDWRFTADQFVLALSPLRPTTSTFFSSTEHLRYIRYVTSSVTRGWICRLQLLLGFASAVVFGSESRGTHDHILLFQTGTPSTWRARSPYLNSPGTRWPSFTPSHWVAFSSPPAIPRARVEVFEPASTQGLKHF